MARDYQETLRMLTHKAAKYIARHRLALHQHMTLEQIEALEAYEAATKRLQDALGPTPIVGVERKLSVEQRRRARGAQDGEA